MVPKSNFNEVFNQEDVFTEDGREEFEEDEDEIEEDAEDDDLEEEDW